MSKQRKADKEAPKQSEKMGIVTGRSHAVGLSSWLELKNATKHGEKSLLSGQLDLPTSYGYTIVSRHSTHTRNTYAIPVPEVGCLAPKR